MNKTEKYAMIFGFAYCSLMSAYMIKTQFDFRNKQLQTHKDIEESRRKLLEIAEERQKFKSS